MSESVATGTTPFTGPHGSFWVVCEDCGGIGSFDDEESWEETTCWHCHGNGGYWDCVDDLCAALIDDWNW